MADDFDTDPKVVDAAVAAFQSAAQSASRKKAEAHGIKALSIGMLVPKDQAVIWRGPMLNSAIRQFLGDVEWGELDYLVIDLPPGTGDVALSLSQSVPVAAPET